ncbi:Helicase_C domain-containing protein/Ribonuclease_3 domain-containing protein/PAZ domain-containing protein/dsRNA_bind domain-containing protein/ResIII domain-containing protein [Cephalotus follicularis]|uniref:Helicase_C domain-containing protein/Ribonuclease_3 domain-containing protein/PAZ domain-containing protein/dsRNA_bind domain-containing protein/ResIII domain-containing protein n=1 Tax=Cephalotus follicularis TaxID=3775 RepID=A0A1Q3CKT5_CEPFO|nr:Helicase_C domain-containing protein/Ribonuclease_3 domain-containing protein/PAZ domain-containing protein/dsRNA_bind domain-containing protein/ResIII domain-containing protein [Cephalotus follicularis]
MHQPENPLKRTFNEMNSDPSNMDLEYHDQTAAASNNFNPRKYQLEIFKVAMKRNTIAVLDTGTGKTLIAVMLIKAIAQASKFACPDKLLIFLAPTVHLVHQQYEVIKIHTNFEVGEYYGAKGIDEWTLKNWEKEINDHEVLVMTPQILLDALRKAFLSINMICLLIIDECHHASGNHPYAKIMKEFYHKSNFKPKIFGMTASPVVRKGVSSSRDCEGQLSELESILDSLIYTIEDRTEVEVHVPSAEQSCRFYDQTRFCILNLKAKMDDALSKFDASLLTLQNSMQISYKDVDDKFKALRRRLLNDYAKIWHCLDDLGLICAYEAVKACLENVPNANEDCDTYRRSILQCKLFLEEVLSIIQESLPVGDEIFLHCGFDYLEAVELGYISPKLHELIQIFLSFRGSKVLSLIFVERIITANVIQRFVKKVSALGHFTVSYLTGSNTSVDALAPKVQKETLESFRSGKVNLLFATDVVEEGIHVPNCSCVIRFDLPKTVRSYIQSRGRARQNNSQFIVMLERGNVKQRDQLFDIIRSEHLIDSAPNTTVNPDARFLKPCTLEETNAYVVEATGASVTADSSVSVLNRYCEKLPRDKFYTPKPSFDYVNSGGSVECNITFPPNSALQTIVGHASKNSHLAKQLACLDACKKLHEMGALDDHLLPSMEVPSDNNLSVKSKETSAGPGTTKRKELHGTTPLRALVGSWKDDIDGALFHAYKFYFSCNIVSQIYSSFVLLIESKLDDDVGDIEVDLYLVAKMVKATVSSCGQVRLDAEQMIKAKCFQEFFFNGLFGRLFCGSKSSSTLRQFLLQNETESLWNQSYMYLLLPIEHDPLKIKWDAINGCTSVVEYLKKNPLLSVKHCNDAEVNLLPSTNGSSETKFEGSVIHFANNSFDIDNLKNMVVMAVHTGKIYSIVQVVSNSSAENRFDGTTDAAPSNFTTFREYFNKKYRIMLMYPGQPLLLLKQSHKPHNLLVDFNDEDACGKAPEAKKPRMHVHMPPELLIHVNVGIDVLKAFYLLPSLMYRLESLMLASQLREEIGFRSSDFHIASSLILEALTTLKCCESFSMERLELLGDSVLKYAVSCHLYLNYPKKHEGQLSALRSYAVCNATLYKLGTDRKVQEYIRDSAFDPRRWVAPGQRSLRPVPCNCGVDSLEVPLDPKFQSEIPPGVVGKCCDLGHRWMGSKTISDCVEALIGAYYISGGLVAALHMMKWLGIDVELDSSLVVSATNSASTRSYTPKDDEIDALESKIGYKFCVKFFLQEAITHATNQEVYCYQRLEFLGDSVLDLLITQHFYQSHGHIDPGELTDLRSASVNNENFAQVAVRRNLYEHLQHCSTLLLSQITEYVKSFPEPLDDTSSAPSKRGPKALGDLVESIAGAILMDTRLDLDEVWRIFKPLLSPIATPEKLELAPLRELNELCDSLGYFIKEKCTNRGEMVHAELRLQLDDVLLVGEGTERTRKLAKGKAACHLLKELENNKISGGVSKRRKLDPLGDLSFMELDINVLSQTIDEDMSETTIHKKQTGVEIISGSLSDNCSKEAGSPNVDIPIIGSINMKKGGPRTALSQLCKTMLWPKPTFETDEQKSRTPMEIDEGDKKRSAFNSFVSKITLHIPGFGSIKCTGDPRADKKSSFDSAAVILLKKLQQQGKLIIDDSK